MVTKKYTNKENKQSNKLKSKATSSKQNTSTIQRTADPNKPPKEKKEEAKISWLKSNPEFAQFIVMFVTLVIYIWVSIDQGKKTRLAVEETKKAVNISEQTLRYTIHSDSINAIAAKQDIVTRERNTEIDLRAYCVITPSVTFLNVSDSTSPGIIFKIKNVGKTPAYNVSTYAMLTITDKKPTHDLIDKAGFNMLIIGSGDESAEQKFFADFTVNKQFFENIKTGKQSLFFLAKVTYKDIFKKNRYLYFGSYYDFVTKAPAAISDFSDAN